MKIIRQGDVLLFPASASVKPKGKKLARKNRLVILALGEATGHHHSIAESGVSLYETEVDGDQLLVVEADGVVLRHQEHKEIVVPRGRYIRRIQREYVAKEIERKVVD